VAVSGSNPGFGRFYTGGTVQRELGLPILPDADKTRHLSNNLGYFVDYYCVFRG
jgi:hypothetical protein